jgi:hypothetical protein
MAKAAAAVAVMTYVLADCRSGSANSSRDTEAMTLAIRLAPALLVVSGSLFDGGPTGGVSGRRPTSWPRSGIGHFSMAEVDERALAQSAGTFGSMRWSTRSARRVAPPSTTWSAFTWSRPAKALGVEVSALLDREITSKVVHQPGSTSPRAQATRSKSKARRSRACATRSETCSSAAHRDIRQSTWARPSEDDGVVSLDPPRVKVEAAGR